MEQQTALVSLDGSAASEAAIPYAAAIAMARAASLRLLRVVARLNDSMIFETPEQEIETIDQLHGEAQSELDEQAELLRQKGFEVSTVIATGNPAEEILRDADTAHATVVAMATHGRGGVERWALGSVADKVMRMGRVPTLIVRPPESPESGRLVELHTLLLPLDGSSLAEAAIEPAAELARATGAELLVLRVEPFLTQSIALAGDGFYMPDLGEMEEEVAANAREYVKGVCAGLGVGLHYRGFVERGFANQLLEPFITEQHVDLVVMSTHGRGGLARLVIGSTADRLVRAGVPCLLIRPAALDEPPTEPKAATAGR